MDVTKTRLQVLSQAASATAGAPKPSLVGVMSNILATDGVKGLYAGLSASLLRQAVYGTARLGLHRAFSDHMREAGGGGPLPAWKTLLSSMGSGAIASVIGNPMDISMVRMQADSLKPAAQRRGYAHVFDALTRIAREEGVTALWRGFQPTVARAIAMNVGMMATYDVAKDAIVAVNGDNMLSQVAASGIAGTACVVTSLPFDLVKTRLQNMTAGADGKMPYNGECVVWGWGASVWGCGAIQVNNLVSRPPPPGVVDCAAKIVKAEGLGGFYVGFGAYWGRTAPHAFIILTSMAAMNKAYSKAFNT